MANTTEFSPVADFKLYGSATSSNSRTTSKSTVVSGTVEATVVVDVPVETFDIVVSDDKDELEEVETLVVVDVTVKTSDVTKQNLESEVCGPKTDDKDDEEEEVAENDHAEAEEVTENPYEINDLNDHAEAEEEYVLAPVDILYVNDQAEEMTLAQFDGPIHAEGYTSVSHPTLVHLLYRKYILNQRSVAAAAAAAPHPLPEMTMQDFQGSKEAKGYYSASQPTYVHILYQEYLKNRALAAMTAAATASATAAAALATAAAEAAIAFVRSKKL